MDAERPALFLGYALSLGAFAALARISLVSTGWRRIPLQRRAVIPEGVVRFSRLLGKFDTTACAASAQVKGQSTVTQSSHSAGEGRASPFKNAPNAKCTKRRLPKERRFAFPCWSLASQQIMADGCSIVPIARRLRSDFPCIRAAHWRCSYRMPACLWAGRK
jgi:hypothetical protein